MKFFKEYNYFLYKVTISIFDTAIKNPGTNDLHKLQPFKKLIYTLSETIILSNQICHIEGKSIFMEIPERIFQILIMNFFIFRFNMR